MLSLLGELNVRRPCFLKSAQRLRAIAHCSLINRHHTWEDVEDAAARASLHGLHCGLHLIAGLPGESHSQIITNVNKACELPIETLKLHQLQVLKGTPLLAQWESGEIELSPFELDDYLNLCLEIVRIVPDHIVIERFLAQSPPDMVVAEMGIKNYQFTNLLNRLISSSER